MINYAGEENVKKRQHDDAEDAVRLRPVKPAEGDDRLLIVCPSCGQTVETEVLFQGRPLTYALHWVAVPARVCRDYSSHKVTSKIVCPNSHLQVESKENHG